MSIWPLSDWAINPLHKHEILLSLSLFYFVFEEQPFTTGTLDRQCKIKKTGEQTHSSKSVQGLMYGACMVAQAVPIVPYYRAACTLCATVWCICVQQYFP